MKRRVFACFLAVLLMFPVVSGNLTQVYAEEDVQMEDIDYSYLLDGNALTGYGESQTWGIYLANGSVSISKYSSTKIAAGGITNAAKTCSLSVSVIVERYKNGGWERVTSWTASKTGDVTVMTSKVLSITTGYKYRVRGYHTAYTDALSTWTNSLQM